MLSAYSKFVDVSRSGIVSNIPRTEGHTHKKCEVQVDYYTKYHHQSHKPTTDFGVYSVRQKIQNQKSNRAVKSVKISATTGNKKGLNL